MMIGIGRPNSHAARPYLIFPQRVSSSSYEVISEYSVCVIAKGTATRGERLRDCNRRAIKAE
jgi:hypothetical protein